MVDIERETKIVLFNLQVQLAALEGHQVLVMNYWCKGLWYQMGTKSSSR